MHVVLLELVSYMQQGYIDNVEKIYLPKINTIIDKTLALNEESKRQMAQENNQKRIAIYEKNRIAQELTLKTARLYLENLKDQQNKVIIAQKVAQRDLILSQNTYSTVELSADLLAILKDSKESFDALISLQVPEIVPFDNIIMQNKYYELSKLLKQ
jgi:hypothetical protein